VNRRDFLRTSGTLAAACTLASRSFCKARVSEYQSFRLEIAPVAVELAPGIEVRTIGYNGQVPGPLLRMREGVPVEIEVANRTLHDDLVHWHGLHISSRMDGASEEGSPLIPPGGTFTYRFIPSPSGSRWYHTHIRAGRNLELGTYTGQFGFLYIEKQREPGDYDQEIFLAVRHWEPSFTKMRETAGDCPEISYRYASFNNRLLGAGEPIRVRQGQRVLFRLLNASPTENVLLSLPGHTFRVTALDGNPVPHPADVEVLSLAVAERIDAVVEMKRPGRWVLGSLNNEERMKGLGVIIEYAGANGKADWQPPATVDWHYGRFSARRPEPPQPAELVTMLIEKKPETAEGINWWTINGKPFPEVEPLLVQKGRRYRLRLVNATACAHPMHLHRHSFELKRIAEVPMSGIVKDTVRVPEYGVADVEFVADQPGPTLFHCHQQLHMDFGLMRMMEYG
jgi:FtsP/CotA-like multicopper oxidase with cupredoxin domain